MSEFADRPNRPRVQLGRERAFASDTRDHLAALRGKNIGACAACGLSVFFEHNFTRYAGRVAHVRCPISADMNVG